MSNIYEALEQAQQEKSFGDALGRKFFPDVERVRTIAPVSEKEVKPLQGTKSKEMAALSLVIDQKLPELSQKTIMVMGSQQGEGVSTVVCEMAKAAATRLGKRVLVLDAATHNPIQHLLFKLKRPTVLNSRENEYGMECWRSQSANLCVASFPPSDYSSLSGDDSSSATLFKDLKQLFDLIIIDSSSEAIAPEQVSLARHVDGVLLVVEAEKTKWFKANKLIDALEGHGGTILGVVFNKRRYHIPRAVYKWLL